MELEDSLYPLLRSVTIGTDPYAVFKVRRPATAVAVAVATLSAW